MIQLYEEVNLFKSPALDGFKALVRYRRCSAMTVLELLEVALSRGDAAARAAGHSTATFTFLLWLKANIIDLLVGTKAFSSVAS